MQLSTAKPGPDTYRVLGVDPGSDTTGYGVIETDGRVHKLVEYSAIKSPAKATFSARLHGIGNRLQEIIERTQPQSFAIEESFFAVNVKSAMKLGHVRGVAIFVAARAGLPVFEYSALAVKLALVGYGRAEKAQVQEMVRLLLKLDKVPHPLDASDALAVAICHIHTSFTTARTNPQTVIR